jgi:proteasome lid subunit RPN8/RPN11
MSDVQDQLQDSLDGSLPKSSDQPPDKKIVFGARKRTEDAVALNEILLLIEAPFPYERTVHWSLDNLTPELEVEANELADDDSSVEPPAPLRTDGEGVEATGDRSTSASSSPTDSAGNVAVVVSQEVLLKVNEHVSQSLEVELGGFLLGNRYRCPNTQRDYVIIDQYSPAKFTESTEVNLAFTHEAWAQLSDELSGKFLGKLLIGWYHSHPRMDVFLSRHDMEIQSERFAEPWMTALVLEPEKHRGGFFCARDGRVKPNSPVDFFELLERNSRESVLAWTGYIALDPATKAAPVISATNTASSLGITSQEILEPRLKQTKRVAPPRKGRRRLLVALVILLLLVVSAVFAVRKSPSLRNRLRLLTTRGQHLRAEAGKVNRTTTRDQYIA